MKVSVFSGNSDQTFEKRLNILNKAAKIAHDNGTDLLVLPGNSIVGSRASVGLLDKIAKTNNLHLIGEPKREKSPHKKDSAFYFFSPADPPKGPYTQVFSTSKEADNNPKLVTNLNSLFKKGKRDFKISGWHYRLMICGEQNILKNIQKENNKVIVRSNSYFTMDYEIIINPCHTTMGNWGKIHKRFSYFSQGNRYLIYTTNNTKKSWLSSICIYHNGKQLLNGNGSLMALPSIEFHKKNDWLLASFSLTRRIKNQH